MESSLAAERERPVGLVAALTAVVSLPLWGVTYVPLYDYPVHLARLQVLHDIESAGPLSKYYEINSLIIPNVAMDVIGMLLQQFLDVQDTGRLFLTLTVFLLISGVGFLSRTLFGRTGYAPWLAAALTFNWVLSTGLINYLFALGLLPWAIGLFIRTRHGSAVPRLACGVLICFSLFFSHLVVFAFYVLIVVALEAQWGLPLLRRNPMKVAGRAVVAGLPILAMAALFVLQSPTAQAAGSPILYGGFRSVLGFFRYKLLWPIRALSSDDVLVDWVSAAATAAVAILIARWGSVRPDRELLVATALIGLMFWIAPDHLFSAQFVDMRMPIAAFLLLAGSTQITIDGPRARSAVSIILLALIGFRSAAIARHWTALGEDEGQITAAFRCLPAQSVLFAAQTDISLLGPSWPPIGHFASIAEITNGAFVPMTAAQPAQQPIAVKSAYADLYSFHTIDPRPIKDASGLQEFAAEIRNLMARRRTAGKDDFGGKVHLLYTLPEPLGHPRIADASIVAAGKLFTLYRLSSAVNQGGDADSTSTGSCGGP